MIRIEMNEEKIRVGIDHDRVKQYLNIPGNCINIFNMKFFNQKGVLYVENDVYDKIIGKQEPVEISIENVIAEIKNTIFENIDVKS